MKKLCFAAAVLSAVCAMAGTAELSSKLLPGKVKVSYILEELISKAGEAEKYKTIVPEKAKIAWSENIIKRGNALDINITITNNSDKPRFLRVLASAAVPFAKFDWWNGYVNVNDQNIIIQKERPEGFRLMYIFKVSGKYIGIYRKDFWIDGIGYYCEFLNANSISKRRDIICFDFEELVDHTAMLSPDEKFRFQKIKVAMRKRLIAFESIVSNSLRWR